MEFTHRIATSNRMLSMFPAHEAVGMLKGTGYSAMEIWTDTLEAQIEEGITTLEQVREALQENGVGAVIHATANKGDVLYNISSKDSVFRERSIGEVMRSIDIGSRLGARLVTVHPGHTDREGENPDEEYWNLQIDAFRKILAEASMHGMAVCIELMEGRPREFILEPEDALRIIGNAGPGIGVTLDTTHAYMNGWKPDDGRIGKIKPHVRHIHMSGHSKVKAHSPFFMSTMDPGYLDAMLRKLTEGYDGTISIEGSLLPGLRNRGKQKEIAESNMQFVREHLKSLRKRS